MVTFEEEPVAASEMERRVLEVSAEFPWLVAEEAGDVVGYAYAGRWQGRCAYRFTVESTVYLDHRAGGRGIGTGLYGALISELRGRSLHGVVGGISLPNPASIALHEKLGFEKVAHFKEVGWKFDKWIEVGYWELLL